MVMMVPSIFVIYKSSFALNCITKLFQKFLIVFSCNCLFFRCVFVMYNLKNTLSSQQHSYFCFQVVAVHLSRLISSNCNVQKPKISNGTVVSSMSCSTSDGVFFCSPDSSLGTNIAATLRMFKSSRKNACAESLLILTSSLIVHTVKRQSAITILFSLATTSFREVCGLPEGCPLSLDVRPFLNRLNHSFICVTPIALSSNAL